MSTDPPTLLSQDSDSVSGKTKLQTRILTSENTELPELLVSGPDTAPTLLFVHGWPDDRSVWNGLIADLARDYRCVRFTLPGYGTEKVCGNSENSGYSLDSTTDIIIKVIECCMVGQEKKDVVVVGHDWGTILCQLVHKKRPDLISKFILLDQGALFPYLKALRMLFLGIVYMWYNAVAYHCSRRYSPCKPMGKCMHRRSQKFCVKMLGWIPPQDRPDYEGITYDESGKSYMNANVSGSCNVFYHEYQGTFWLWFTIKLFGILTWALPVKLFGDIPLRDPEVVEKFPCLFIVGAAMTEETHGKKLRPGMGYGYSDWYEMMQTTKSLPRFSVKFVPGGHWFFLHNPEGTIEVMRSWLNPV